MIRGYLVGSRKLRLSTVNYVGPVRSPIMKIVAREAHVTERSF
jgi:hypothetical protein